MAYAVLISVEQAIAQILNHDSHSISPHEKQQIISMNENVTLLKEFLKGSQEKAGSLEGRIWDLANEVENFMVHFRRRKLKFSKLDKLATEVDSVHREVLGIMKKARVGVDDGSHAAADSSSSSRLATVHRKDAMVGFDNDLLAIKARLCGESSNLRVVSLVGMGGIGKTTLATNAYHDPSVIEHFQIRAWVTLSQDYSTHKVLSDLFASLKELNTERSGKNNELNVYQTLKGRRYLIVMDDIWTTKAWDDVKRIFPDDYNGSRIILTTRLSNVAAYADSSSPLHEMRLMDNDQSWDLLYHKVFAHDERCTAELESIGKEVARSCGGLPLALSVIGGLLSTVSKNPASWKEIAKNVKSVIKATNDGQLEKIFSLSYIHLPLHLRPCFLYMGVFPEDYKIHIRKLIKLWVAEGFVEPSACRSFEEGAEEYLEDLVKRSLVMVSDRKSNGKIKSCGVHDVIRDLCIRRAKREKFFLNVMDREVSKNSIKHERRVCISQPDPDCLADVYDSAARTIIICFMSVASSQGYLQYFRLLRVLDVVYAIATFPSHREIVTLPSQVFELIHLKYIAFGYPIHIPSAISNLQNLQTLIIHQGTTLWDQPWTVNLPSEIWRMPQLRHLVCRYFGELPMNTNYEGESTCALENLQTLSSVTDLVCTESILKMIPNVKKLGIFYSEGKYCEDFQLHNLVHLQHLEKLKITVDPFRVFWWKMINNPTFPMTLKKLTLDGWEFPNEDMMRIVGSLPNLQVLKLRNFACDGDKWETNDGEFVELEFLQIENSTFRYWITESSHFPRLKWLQLHQCWWLEEIPDGIAEITTLELIELKNCPRTLADSAKKLQEEQQQEYGNDTFEVRCSRCTL